MVDSTREAVKTEKIGGFDRFKAWCRDALKSRGEDGKKAEAVLDTIDREEFKHFGDWCMEGNYFGFYNEGERDEKKVGWSADRAANELAVTTFGGVAATTIGALLIPFCPLLGIAIIAGGNIPRPVFNSLKKYVNEETFGLLPLDQIVPSPTGEFSDFAHGDHKRIDEQIERFNKVVKNVEESLKKQAVEEKAKAELVRQKKVAEKKDHSASTPIR
ncbi:MAG: hypothetical protein PHY80_03560 [Rickettsiales bacterium]|nr:hypothetical protein [Rickettsiales bacterium]